MWVGLIQSLEGLENKDRFPKEEGIVFLDRSIKWCLSFQPLDSSLKYQFFPDLHVTYRFWTC